jgi:hypothetical protein
MTASLVACFTKPTDDNPQLTSGGFGVSGQANGNVAAGVRQ